MYLSKTGTNGTYIANDDANSKTKIKTSENRVQSTESYNDVRNLVRNPYVGNPGPQHPLACANQVKQMNGKTSYSSLPHILKIRTIKKTFNV